MNKEEKWMPIPGYEGLYEASDMGRVRSLKYKSVDRIKILSPGNNGHGYLFVNLTFQKSVKNHYVHRIVYEAFNGNIEDNKQIDHINGIRNDNRLINLRPLDGYDNSIAAIARKRNDNRTHSKYTGVTKCGNSWKINIRVEGKQRHIGSYCCEHIAGFVAEFALKGILPVKVQDRIDAEKNKKTNENK